jgi:hypothetical protein
MAMSPYLVNDYDAGLELGLSIRAIGLAGQQGLRAAETPFGKVYWVPLVHEWAARSRRVPASSLTAQAVHLTKMLGLDVEEGTVRCGMCEARGLDTPGIALRRCAFCQTALCMDDTCGDYYSSDKPDSMSSVPTACATCFVRRQLLRRGADGFLPGHGGYAEQLAKRFEETCKKPTPNQLHGFVSVVEAAHKETLARREAIRAALDAEPALADPATRPDIGLNLRVALGAANRDVTEMGRLLARVKAALEATHLEPK